MTFKVKVKHWHAVASWTWNAGDDVCGICRVAFDGCPPDGKYPGDDSPVVWGVCGHAFHLQCIQRWLASQAEQRCPFCRRPWEFKSAAPPEGEEPAQQQQLGDAAMGVAHDGETGSSEGDDDGQTGSV